MSSPQSDSLAEIVDRLKVKTPKSELEYVARAVFQKDQSTTEGTALAIPNITARFTTDRLDESCGPLGWATEIREVRGYLAVGIGIRNPETAEWVWKWDTGDVGKSDDDGFGGKGLVSNGVKRAGYLWGIGRDTYKMDVVRFPCTIYMKDGKAKFKHWIGDPGGRKRIASSVTGSEKLADAGPASEGSKNAEAGGEGASSKLAPTIANARAVCYDFAVEELKMSRKEAETWLKNQETEGGNSIEAYRGYYTVLRAKFSEAEDDPTGEKLMEGGDAES